MKFICDTREQHPWAAPKHREMVRACLPFGDYSVDGYQQRLCVERKSIDDLVSSLFGDWKRFSARLTEFRELVIQDRKGLACIVAECTEEDVRKRKYVPDTRSIRRVGKSAYHARRLDELPPARILTACARIYAEYGVPVFLAGSPTRASAFAFAVLTHWVEREGAKDPVGADHHHVRAIVRPDGFTPAEDGSREPALLEPPRA